MKVSIGVLLRGAFWTVAGFGAGQAIRLVTNVILARVLAPQLFGLSLLVNTIRTGIELTSDLGIGQNIIYSQHSSEPEFYNTAWTLQIIRSVFLFILIVVLAAPVASLYNIASLSYLLPITGTATLFYGFVSVAPLFLQKRLQLGRLNAFQLIVSAISSVVLITFCYLSPTILALVIGGAAGTAIAAVASYFLLPDIKQRFMIDRRYIWEILHFGKWITLSSIVYFASTNIDRLYLAKAVPLEIVGIFSIARSISDLLINVSGRLASTVVFPFVASHLSMPRADLQAQLTSIRGRFLLSAAFGCSLLVAGADLVIKILYDQRYHAAGWMLPILALGSWFAILASLNESTLLGLGAPSYMAASNSLKFILLVIGLPVSLNTLGLVGAIVTLSLVEASRYVPIFIGQRRHHFSYGRQDLSITIAMFLMVGLWEWLRWISGFGTSLDSLPVIALLGGSQ